MKTDRFTARSRIRGLFHQCETIDALVDIENLLRGEGLS
jgi:hypothetical protein